MRVLIARAERFLRVLFHIATTLMLCAATTRAPMPLSLGMGVLAAGLLVLGWRNLPFVFRRNQPTAQLRAELLSVGAAMALLILSFAMRTGGRPVGIIDAVALGAVAYFCWRIRVIGRHLRDGTLPVQRMSGTEQASRTFKGAIEYGRSRRAEKGDA